MARTMQHLLFHFIGSRIADVKDAGMQVVLLQRPHNIVSLFARTGQAIAPKLPTPAAVYHSTQQSQQTSWQPVLPREVRSAAFASLLE